MFVAFACACGSVTLTVRRACVGASLELALAAFKACLAIALSPGVIAFSVTSARIVFAISVVTGSTLPTLLAHAACSFLVAVPISGAAVHTRALGTILTAPGFMALTLARRHVALTFTDIGTIHWTPLHRTCRPMPTMRAHAFSFCTATAVFAGWFATFFRATSPPEHTKALAPAVTMVANPLFGATTVTGAHRFVANIAAPVTTANALTGVRVAPSTVSSVAWRFTGPFLAVAAFESFEALADTFSHVAFATVARCVAV